MTTPGPMTCPVCGNPAEGRFCSSCGASLTPRGCEGCGAQLSQRARFCHRCGRPAPGPGTASSSHRSERFAWILAGVACVLLVGVIVYKVAGTQPAPQIPAMANPGAAATPGARPATAEPAPDISRMTPRERFDRLFNRIMQAAEVQDTAEVVRFTPMALGAYAQLDDFDADARYHAAVLHLQVGDAAAAAALADTILAQSPGHLFGYLIRGSVAEVRGDQVSLARARREFLDRFPAESAARRPEYADHAPVIDEFKREAERRPAGS